MLTIAQQNVIFGRDGWLFMYAGTNRLIEQHCGVLQFTADDLRTWRLTMALREAWMAEHGITYRMLVCPNKEAVYEEMFETPLEIVALRPVLQLSQHLTEHGFKSHFLYPYQQLRAARVSGDTYCRTDSHWNHRGAFVGYHHLMESLALPPLAEAAVQFHEQSLAGDLGGRFKPAYSAPTTYAKIANPRAKLISDNKANNRGRIIVYEHSDSRLPRCVFFGDSFSMRMIPFLAESFSRLVLVHQANIDFDLVDEERPDVVIAEMVERFLIKIPDDLRSPPARELAQVKEPIEAHH